MKNFILISCFAIFSLTNVSCQKTKVEKDTVIVETTKLDDECPPASKRPTQPQPPKTTENYICILPIEISPRFPGCENDSLTSNEKKKCADEKLFHFIYTNLKLPRDFCGEGTVVVRFIIETNGTITQPEVIRDIGGGCGEETLRVVKMMPKWVPGELNGKKVRMLMNLPVKFKLE